MRIRDLFSYVVLIVMFAILIYSTFDLIKLSIHPELAIASPVEKSIRHYRPGRWGGFNYYTTEILLFGNSINVVTNDPIEKGQQILIQYSNQFKDNCIAVPYFRSNPLNLFELLWVSKFKWAFPGIVILLFGAELVFRKIKENRKKSEGELWLEEKAAKNIKKRNDNEEDE